jgi:CheY-like chemotaxis protein
VNKQACILIVDRNPHVRSLVKREMAKRGYRVQQAKDGRGLLSRVGSEDEIDFLIVDADLPDMTFDCLYDLILRNFAHIPVAIHTDGLQTVPDSLPGNIAVVRKCENSIEQLEKVVIGTVPICDQKT